MMIMNFWFGVQRHWRIKPVQSWFWLECCRVTSKGTCVVKFYRLLWISRPHGYGFPRLSHTRPVDSVGLNPPKPEDWLSRQRQDHPYPWFMRCVSLICGPSGSSKGRHLSGNRVLLHTPVMLPLPLLPNWFKVVSKLYQSCIKVVPKFSQSCIKVVSV